MVMVGSDASVKMDRNSSTVWPELEYLIVSFDKAFCILIRFVLVPYLIRFNLDFKEGYGSCSPTLIYTYSPDLISAHDLGRITQNFHQI